MHRPPVHSASPNTVDEPVEARSRRLRKPPSRCTVAAANTAFVSLSETEFTRALQSIGPPFYKRCLLYISITWLLQRTHLVAQAHRLCQQLVRLVHPDPWITVTTVSAAKHSMVQVFHCVGDSTLVSASWHWEIRTEIRFQQHLPKD